MFQQSICLFLEYVVECFNLVARTHELRKELSIFTPSVTKGDEGRTFVPPDKLSSHHESRAVTVESALLVKHVKCIIYIVEHNDGISKGADIYNSTLENKVRDRQMSKARCIPYVLPHRAKVSHG